MVSTRSLSSNSKLSLLANVFLARTLVSAATTVDFFAHTSCNAGTALSRLSISDTASTSSGSGACRTTPGETVALYANPLDTGCTISAYSDTACTRLSAQTIQAGTCFFTGAGTRIGSLKINCADTTLNNLVSSLSSLSEKANTINDDADASTRTSDQDPTPNFSNILNSLTGDSGSDDLTPGNDSTYEAISGSALPAGYTTNSDGALVTAINATPLTITGGVATMTGSSTASSVAASAIATSSGAAAAASSTASVWAWTQTLNASTTYSAAVGGNGTYSATVSPPIATYAGNGAGRLGSGIGAGFVALLCAGIVSLLL